MRVSARRTKKRNSPSASPRSTGRQQVAAVCFRIGVQGLEFLLVQSRGGRWIFPKGGVEPGLTQAQSAALEAFEEAGAHGRIEETPFARYRSDRIARKSAKDSRKEATAGEAITAHLCEVSHLEPPQEADRNPTWFSAQKAKRRLLADRSAELGDELAGVVDRAVARIQRQQIRESHNARKDPLQKVRFEAFDELGSDALMRYILRNNLPQRNRGEASTRKVLGIGTAGRLQLGSGAPVLQRGRKN